LEGIISAQEIESSKPKVQTSRPRPRIHPNLVEFDPEKSIYEKLERERIAWDYYGPAWMGILKQIRREKTDGVMSYWS
jgi:hypothetical protein